jgi:hypothetical protein
MTLNHLLPAALVVCSLPAFAQDQQLQSSGPSTLLIEMRSGTGFISQSSVMMESFLGPMHAATPAEPWKFIPNQPADALAERNALDRLQIDKYKVFRSKSNTRTLLLGPDADAGMFISSIDGLGSGATCYKIRSYVVARDSKNSDSTHPVSYSTCQPAARYQLRTTEIRSGSAER